MKSIAFFNIPAYGHIGPSLPVVEHLVKQGARVLYYVDEAYREVVAETGAEFRAMPDFSSLPKGRMPGCMVQFALMLAEQTVYGMPYLREQIAAEQVRLIVHDHMCLWGRSLAQIEGLPSVRTCSILLAFDGVMPRARMSPRVLLNQLPYWRDLIRFRRLAARLHREFGLPELAMADVLKNRGDLNILFTSPAYLPHAERLDSSYRLVGASISDRALDPLRLPDRRGRPLVYISLGTAFNQRTDFYRVCQTALGSTDVFVVLSLGKQTDPASLGPWPDNFYVAPSVPQVEVLKQASVFVSQAGGCSVNESLVQGVPLVMWPQTFEHAFNADCVVGHGAGVRLGARDVTPDRLRDVIFRVLGEPEYHDRARRIGATLREAGGAPRAAEEILAFLRSQPER